jgi:hypothetical protein
LKETLRYLAQGVADVAKLFPYGITKVSVAVKVAGNELSLDVEGPQTAHPDARQMDSSSLARDSTAIVFTITQRIGRKARGRLTWAAKALDSPAVSGDSAHDAINVGSWAGINFMERPGDDAYCDKSGHCWFSVFKDAYGRTDMGIHPDGGVPDATLGCIGLTVAGTQAWHDALQAVQGRVTCEVVEARKISRHPDDGVLERSSK